MREIMVVRGPDFGIDNFQFCIFRFWHEKVIGVSRTLTTPQGRLKGLLLTFVFKNYTVRIFGLRCSLVLIN